MPLVFAPSNSDLVIKKLPADDRTRKHLQEIGITVGSTIKLLSSTERGVIIAVKEGRLCLDGELARGILVAA